MARCHVRILVSPPVVTRIHVMGLAGVIATTTVQCYKKSYKTSLY